MKSILLVIPNLGWVRKEVMLKVIEFVGDKRFAVELYLPVEKPYEQSMNRSVRYFLENGYDYFFTMDSDNPPYGNPLELTEKNLDIVILPTPIVVPSKKAIYYNVFSEEAGKFVGYRKRQTGLQEIASGGSGAMIVSRNVLSKIKSPFSLLTDDDGVLKTNGDGSFCLKSRQAGFKIYASWDHACRHFKEVDLTELMDWVDLEVKMRVDK